MSKKSEMKAMIRSLRYDVQYHKNRTIAFQRDNEIKNSMVVEARKECAALLAVTRDLENDLCACGDDYRKATARNVNLGALVNKAALRFNNMATIAKGLEEFDDFVRVKLNVEACVEFAGELRRGVHEA